MAAQGGGSADRLRAAGQAEPGEGTAGVPDDKFPQEISVARKIRAQRLASGLPTAEIAAVIHDKCGPVFGTTWIRAYRLALGITLADVVAQVRARYEAEGRTPPRFSETLLSAYESAQKRPGPEYLHYLCAVYHADPRDLGYQDPCFCGNRHRRPEAAGFPAPAWGDGSAGVGHPAGGQGAAAAEGPTGWEGSAGAGGAGGGDGIHGAAVRWLSAVPPVPAPRDGADAVRADMPRGGAAGGGAGVTPVTLVPAPAEGAGQDAGGEADDDVLRLALLRLIAGAGTPVDGRFFGVVDRVRRRMDEALLGASVSATMLDQWEDTAGGYGRQYMSIPPLRLLCDVLLDLGDVRRMCEERQPLESAERLRRLAAKLAALSGMTMINIGDQRLARSFFRTARMAADETGDRHLRGWVAVRESMVPLYYGDPGEAALLARAGGDLAGRNPCVARVMAPVLEARALARLASGGYSSVRETLGRAKAGLERARQALDALPGDVRSDTAFGYTERQFLFHQGDALVTLGDHKGAEGVFKQALRMYSRAEILDRSLIMLGQARCRLEADEPEEALRLSRDTVLALPQHHRSGLAVRAARSLGEAVAASHGDLPALREYREALLTG
jgi:transcriptional regulator with XRE-family HTH domain/tetratricopeptide (TPR) repeat protein